MYPSPVPTGRLRCRLTAILPMLLSLTALGACSPTEPDDVVEEYSFVVTAPAGVIITGEVYAWAMQEDGLLEIRETVHGEMTGEDLTWSATAMVRAAMEGGEFEPAAEGGGWAAAGGVPAEVVVGTKKALVVGLRLHGFGKLDGTGTVEIEGRINDAVAIRVSLTEPGEATTLTLGSAPGGSDSM